MTKNQTKMENYKFEKYWYLGFLGLVGVYKLPLVMAYFQGNGSAWDLANLLWLLWFLNFIPVAK
jgi:hypothetical protein